MAVFPSAKFMSLGEASRFAQVQVVSSAIVIEIHSGSSVAVTATTVTTTERKSEHLQPSGWVMCGPSLVHSSVDSFWEKNKH